MSGLHKAIGRLIECSCGKNVAAEKYEQHRLDAMKDEGLDDMRRTLRQAARANRRPK